MIDQYSRQARRGRLRRIGLVFGISCIAASALLSLEGVANRAPASSAPPLFNDVETPLMSPVVSNSALERATLTTDIPIPEAPPWIDITVKPGETFSTLVEAHGMLKSDWVEVLALGGDTARLKRLRVGDQLQLRANEDGRLDELAYPLDEINTLQVRRIDGRLEALTLAADVETRELQAHGVITSSLFAAGAASGLSDRVIMAMAEVFGYDIDFALDLREGDRFSVIYEALYRDGEKLRDGRILAAEFVNQRRVLHAFHHEDSEGKSGYYNVKGESLKTAFRRTPLDFARISSHFNLKRRHPILNTIRAHKGVDYAAGTGTPIRSTGDGRVAFIGVKGGYGRTVVVKHGAQYETLYAHMSRFRAGLKTGQRVSQGQIIGYVGATGLATAPHLHYEFRVNGVHKNPVTVPLPRANPLTATQLAAWQPRVQNWVAQLEALSAQQVAQRNEDARATTAR